MKKTKCSFSKKSLIGTLIVVTTIAMTMPVQSWAMLVPTQTAVDGYQANEARSADLKTIQTALESKIIRQRLTELKLSTEQIDNRLSKLSDSQIHQTAMQIRSVSPGGDGGGFIISALVIAILVVVFLYIFRRI